MRISDWSSDVCSSDLCYRAGDIAAVLTIAREFGFRVGAIHHATESYKIPGLLREAGTCAAVWADWWGFKLEAQDAVRAEAPLPEREIGRARVCTPVTNAQLVSSLLLENKNNRLI